MLSRLNRYEAERFKNFQQTATLADKLNAYMFSFFNSPSLFKVTPPSFRLQQLHYSLRTQKFQLKPVFFSPNFYLRCLKIKYSVI